MPYFRWLDLFVAFAAGFLAHAAFAFIIADRPLDSLVDLLLLLVLAGVFIARYFR